MASSSAPASIEQLRRERAERYRQLGDGERPKVAVCGDCGEATYLRQVCPATGVFHNLEKHTIIGGMVLDDRFVRSSDLMAAIDMTRVKWAPSRTQLVKADATALNIFQSFVYQMEWNLQRYGLLYGKVDAVTNQVEVHAVYEPEQHGTATEFAFEPDPRIATVDHIASLLGLRRVGAICTHPPRNTEEMLLSSREMLLCAREQSRFGDHCVLLTISPQLETGTVECQAWQVSAQAVHFYRLGLLRESPKDPKYVESTRPLELAQDDTDDKGHQRCITKAPSNLIDTRWFTGYVAVEQFQSPIIGNTFVRISRPGLLPPTWANLRNYLKDPKRTKLRLVEQLADFHVLIFLAERMFDLQCDMPLIIGAILAKSQDQLGMYAEVLKAQLETS